MLLLIDGALLLVQVLRPTLALTDAILIPLAIPAVAFLAALVRAAAFLLAATGLHHEIGFAADSRLGRTGLIVWGLRDLVFLAVELGGTHAPSPAITDAALTLNALSPIAALVGAIAIARARVLVGPARWALLPLALIDVILGAIFTLPATGFTEAAALALASPPTGYFEAGAVLLIALTLLTWGRTEAVKHRAKNIYDAW